DEFLVNDVDDLFAGVESPQHFLADGSLSDALGKLGDDSVVDVRVEEGFADLAHRVADVGLGDAAAAAQLLAGLGEVPLSACEHGGWTPILGPSKSQRRYRILDGAEHRCNGAHT